MRIVIIFFLLAVVCNINAQNLQIHYDLRHTSYPSLNTKNFPTFNFEYFKTLDSLHGGSFFLKLQTDLSGKNLNPGQVFTQVSQSLRFWKPNIFLGLTYSGGLGIADPSYGYYIANSFGIGAAYPFQWKGAWVSLNLFLRYNAFDRPSYDPQCTLYFGRGFLDYKIFLDGSFVFWTQNRNTGDPSTILMTGKKFSFYGDPKIWFKVWRGLSLGTRVSVYYNLLGSEGDVQFYPTFGSKIQF